MADEIPLPGAADRALEPGAAHAPAADGEPIAPITSVRRIETLDVLRGVAVLGILMMNIPGFAMAWEGVANPLDIAGPSIFDKITLIGSDVLFEGTMRGMFSLLFGAGVVLLTSRIEQRAGTREARRIHYRRTIWLIIFGLIHAYVLLWIGDILFSYGVIALLLYPMRNLRPRTLILVGVAALAVQQIATTIEHVGARQQHADYQEAQRLMAASQPVPEDLKEAHDEWAEALNGDPEKTREQLETMRSGYFTIMASLAPRILEIQTLEFGMWGLWDGGGMMLIGMALMKLGVLSGTRPRRVYVRMMLIGYAFGLTVNIAEAVVFGISQARNDPLLEYYSWYTYDVARVPMTLGHVGTIVLLLQAGIWPRLIGALAAVGRMALTNYIGQTVICTMLFFGYGFGLFGRLSHSEVMLVMISIWIVQLAFSVAWLRRFRFGPLEWLWRSLTYMKMQPMRLAGEATAVE